jgi:hypothetical protein
MRQLSRTTLQVISTLVALASAGCAKQSASGELVGAYAVRGQLTDNTCGQAALPSKNLLSYTVELRNDNGAATWLAQKQSSASGSLGSGGEFHFETQQEQDMGTTVQVRQNLQPGDLLTTSADPDLVKRHCILITDDALSGVVNKRLPSLLDGSVGNTLVTDAGSDAGATSTSADLTGDETVQIMVATGADCTAALAVQGGPYTILPCGLHYKLEGTLQPAQ